MSIDEARLRRVAVQTVAQLPEDYEEAVAVLGYAIELLESFVKPAERRIGVLQPDGMITWLNRN